MLMYACVYVCVLCMRIYIYVDILEPDRLAYVCMCEYMYVLYLCIKVDILEHEESARTCKSISRPAYVYMYLRVQVHYLALYTYAPLEQYASTLTPERTCEITQSLHTHTHTQAPWVFNLSAGLSRCKC